VNREKAGFCPGWDYVREIGYKEKALCGVLFTIIGAPSYTISAIWIYAGCFQSARLSFPLHTSNYLLWGVWCTIHAT
jgi:hypothetical protein